MCANSFEVIGPAMNETIEDFIDESFASEAAVLAL